MTQQPELLAVTQKDREAAASYWRQSRIGSEETYRSYLIGERDNSFIVQAFARHLLQSTAAAFCVSSTDINTVCEQPEGVSVTTTAPEGGPDAAIVTGGGSMIETTSALSEKLPAAFALIPKVKRAETSTKSRRHARGPQT